MSDEQTTLRTRIGEPDYMVTTIPPGHLNLLDRVTAKTCPMLVVYGTQNVELAVGESAVVQFGKLVKAAPQKPE